MLPAYTGQYPLFDALRKNFCVASGDFGGDTWGNKSAMNDVLAVKGWMQTMGARPGKVALVGISMGTLTSLNFAHMYPEQVACVVDILPAINLADFANNNRSGYSAESNAVYPGGYSDAVYGSIFNPYYYASSLTIPVKLFYSTADTVALPTYVTGFAANCPTASATVVSSTLNHSEAAVGAAPLNSILSFISKHVNQ